MLRFLSLFLLVLTVEAKAGGLCPLPQKDCEDTLSKTIRSHADHFWCSVKKYKWPVVVKSLLQHEGVVVGDPHLGNFAVIPVETQAGQKRLQFVNVDFDDAGEGPFLLDFLRLYLATKAIDKDLRNEDSHLEQILGFKEMWAAYLEGLKGGSVPVPDRIQKDLDIGLKGYEKELADLVEKKLKSKDKNRLSTKDDEFEELQPNDIIQKEVAAKYLPGYEILDVVRLRKKRGGSAKEDRFWVLVKDSQKQKRIFEFKGWSQTGLSSYQKQKKPLDWAQQLGPVMWPGLKIANYDLHKIKGQYFWIREKRKVLTDVPYDLKKKKDVLYLQQSAEYFSYTLGQIHRRQNSAQKYLKALEKVSASDELQEALKTFVKEYFKSLKSN